MNNLLNPDSVGLLNDDILKLAPYLEGRWLENLAECTVDAAQSPKVSEAAKILQEKGICVVKNFLSHKACYAVSEELDTLIARSSSTLGEQDFLETQSSILTRPNVSRAPHTYEECANSTKSVFHFRGGCEEGVIDIFNVDRCLNSSILQILKPLRAPWLAALVNSSGGRGVFANLNCYWSAGTLTREPFHVDSYSNTFKLFVLVKDCLSYSNGPYCYIAGSHKSEHIKTLNKALSSHFERKTLAPLVDVLNLVPSLGVAGTAVLSNQSGVHRGFPQDKDSDRTLLVQRIY